MNCHKPLSVGRTGRQENPAELNCSSWAGIINLPRNPINRIGPSKKKKKYIYITLHPKKDLLEASRRVIKLAVSLSFHQRHVLLRKTPVQRCSQSFGFSVSVQRTGDFNSSCPFVHHKHKPIHIVLLLCLYSHNFISVRQTLKLMYSRILFTLKTEINLLSAVTIAHYSLPPYCNLKTLYMVLDLHIFL